MQAAKISTRCAIERECKQVVEGRLERGIRDGNQSVDVSSQTRGLSNVRIPGLHGGGMSPASVFIVKCAEEGEKR